MSHVSDEVLAALALGDPDVPAADRDHASTCPVCAHEVGELRAVHDMLSAERGLHGSHRVEPGPLVWERILASTYQGSRPEEALGPDGKPGLHVVPKADPAPAPLPPAAAPPSRRSARAEVPVASTAGPRAEPTRSPSRGRGRRTWWVAGLAAAALVLGVLVGRAVWAPSTTTQPVVASVSLTTLDAAKVPEGTAQLLGGPGGQAEQLRVATTPMSPGSGNYVEVWLINTDGKRMVSLGTLNGTEGVFSVPADAIADGYTVVDLSREQYDDRPQHSGDSIMRGTLPI